MKERTFIIVLAIVLGFVGIYMFSLYSLIQVATGNVYAVHVVSGCDLVDRDMAGTNPQLTEDVLNFVTVEYGMPKDGMSTGMLRDLCSDQGEDKCKSAVISYCRAAMARS